MDGLKQRCSCALIAKDRLMYENVIRELSLPREDF